MFNKFSSFESNFANWRRDGYPGVKPETYRYIESLIDPEDDQRPRRGTLWPHQWEAYLRVIYAHEILGHERIGNHGYLLNIVTGGGKTAVIAALIAWLRIAHDVRKFLLLCPNLIVRDRLEDDFERGKVFRDRDLLPKWAHCDPEDFVLATLGSDRQGGMASLFSADVVLGNIHQFYLSNKAGKSNMAGLMNGPDFALFNDEAHNSPAEEYDRTLQRMEPKIRLRVDTTATPDRADGRTPDSDMVYEYGIAEALHDQIVTTPVVYQPSITTVELTYTDARTGERKKVEEIDWDEVDRLGLTATQWVTDDEPMRQQMAIALKRLEEQERRADGRYQPILFVVAVSKADAQKAALTLNKYFKVKTLLVTEDSEEADRKKATELGREQRTKNPYKAVVSVLMLREGWDVPEVGVILLLRKFSSRVYGQQVIGRGLRRVRRENIAPNEPQICAVVDHPKLDHQWLWDIFGSKIRHDVKIDELFDETEDLPPPPPKQELVSPELIIDLPDPDPALNGDDEFEIDAVPPPAEPLENWCEVLKTIEYDPVAKEITGVNIAAVVGKELRSPGWKQIHSAPNAVEGAPAHFELSDEMLRDAIQEALLDYAEQLTVEAGYAAGFKGDVYHALILHVRDRFLDGHSLGLADKSLLTFAFKMLGQVRIKVGSTPGLVAGIIEYGDQ